MGKIKKPVGYQCSKCKTVYAHVDKEPKECYMCHNKIFKPLSAYKLRQALDIDENIEVD